MSSASSGIGIAAESTMAMPPRPQRPSACKATFALWIQREAGIFTGVFLFYLFTWAHLAASIPIGGGVVLSAASQQVERVGQQRENRCKRSAGAPNTSRQVDDERLAHGPAHAPAERGQRRLAGSLSAHPLGKSVDQPVADHPRRLGGHIARRKPRSACRDNQL